VTARSFALSVIIGASLLLGTTLCANVLTDPQGVFGVEVIARSADPNWRYLLFKQYQRDASLIDGIIFGSSRAAYIDGAAFGDRIGSPQVLRFAVPYGLITDHLPLLQYVLNDKRARGEQLKSVLLLLDLDFFGKTPWTNTNINAFLPPAVSGESAVRFWWRYLTAFQHRKWRDSVRRRNQNAVSKQSGSTKKGAPIRQSAVAGFPVIAIGRAGDASRSIQTAASDQLADEAVALLSHRSRKSWNAERPDLARQISYLAQFVELCRNNNVSLTVATSPMSHANMEGYPDGELEALTKTLNYLTPIWDFSSPKWLADNPSYWADFSHFSDAVGLLMLDRMFLKNSSTSTDFGRLRPQLAP
jgi:hypothetical protein